jgi:DNA-binding transcriptional ArsR family regulator
MTIAEQPILAIQAELFRAMGNALSQEIVHCLRDGPMSGGELANAIEVSQATISRHLIVLRNAGVVVGRREGSKILYRIANPKIMQVCDLMREVLIEQIRLQMVPFTHEKRRK